MYVYIFVYIYMCIYIYIYIHTLSLSSLFPPKTLEPHLIDHGHSTNQKIQRLRSWPFACRMLRLGTRRHENRKGFRMGSGFPARHLSP